MELLLHLTLQLLCLFTFVAAQQSDDQNSSIQSLLQDLSESKSHDLNVEAELDAMRRQIHSMSSELKSVKHDLSSCMESTSTLRNAENDHVRLHWVQGEMAEIRGELAELAKRAEANAMETYDGAVVVGSSSDWSPRGHVIQKRAGGERRWKMT